MGPNRLQVFHTNPKPARSSHLMRLIRAELIETEVVTTTISMHNPSKHQLLTKLNPNRPAVRTIGIMSNRSRGAGVEGVAKSLNGTVFGQRNFFYKTANIPYCPKPEYCQFARGNR